MKPIVEATEWMDVKGLTMVMMWPYSGWQWFDDLTIECWNNQYRLVRYEEAPETDTR